MICIPHAGCKHAGTSLALLLPSHPRLPCAVEYSYISAFHQRVSTRHCGKRKDWIGKTRQDHAAAGLSEKQWLEKCQSGEALAGRLLRCENAKLWHGQRAFILELSALPCSSCNILCRIGPVCRVLCMASTPFRRPDDTGISTDNTGSSQHWTRSICEICCYCTVP